LGKVVPVAARNTDGRHGVLVDEVLQTVAFHDEGVTVEAPQDPGEPLAGEQIDVDGPTVLRNA
jgi:hypothetical protein